MTRNILFDAYCTFTGKRSSRKSHNTVMIHPRRALLSFSTAAEPRPILSYFFGRRPRENAERRCCRVISTIGKIRVTGRGNIDTPSFRHFNSLRNRLKWVKADEIIIFNWPKLSPIYWTFGKLSGSTWWSWLDPTSYIIPCYDCAKYTFC